MCSPSQVALTVGLPWPWSWPVLLAAMVPLVVCAVAVVVLVGKLTSSRDRRRFVALVRQRVGRWLP